MTKYQFHAQRLNALDCASAEQYIAECGGSMPAEYYAEGADIVSAMRNLWELAHDFTFAKLLSLSGQRLTEFVRDYGIPLRTAENWKAGTSAPPEYVLELLAADVLSIKQ